MSHSPVAAEDVHAAVVKATCGCLDHCLSVIEHCVSQLTDDELWWRPNDGMNSIGNLLLHLDGNLRQWMVAGLGGADYDRDRPGEFAERTHIPAGDLLSRLRETLDEAKQTLSAASAGDMLRQRRVQGFDLNGWEVVFDSVPHLKGHAQEITNLTRQQLGDRYQFRWQPATAEQGAPS
jgi:hypothetical protein